MSGGGGLRCKTLIVGTVPPKLMVHTRSGYVFVYVYLQKAVNCTQAAICTSAHTDKRMEKRIP